MAIAVGAPNIVRGGSTSGNQDAQELFELGLADIIVADYHAPSLLLSAFQLVRSRVVDLPTAIRTLTFNPARAVGLADVGAIREGYRADLIVVREQSGSLPAVEAVYREGLELFAMREPVAVGGPAW
jgi:alpha-D-ribose 1-methylphosphonate 5-triphosphate diphosphatase